MNRTVKTLGLITGLLISSFSVVSAAKIDAVLVDKSDSRLYLKSKGQVVKAYHVVFGANPKGHKQQEGDERTPEGLYFLDYKNSTSGYYKSIHISYPNKRDKQQAKLRGVNPGGAVMIHGQKNGWGWLWFLPQLFNWTNGCIALKDADMEEVWQAVKLGTPIQIQP